MYRVWFKKRFNPPTKRSRGKIVFNEIVSFCVFILYNNRKSVITSSLGKTILSELFGVDDSLKWRKETNPFTSRQCEKLPVKVGPTKLILLQTETNTSQYT